MGPDYGEVLAARQRISGLITETPLVRSTWLSRLANGNVWLKMESRQIGGSFKIRGAANKLILMQEMGATGAIFAASAGNHALGLAMAARELGIGPVRLFVPAGISEAKLRLLQSLDAELTLVEGGYDEAARAARSEAVACGAVVVPAYDDRDVIAGQGTVFLEILEILGQVDLAIVPTGGGGLLAGCVIVALAAGGSTVFIAAQPAASPALRASMRAGMALDPFPHQSTAAEGLAGGFGQLPYSIVADHVGSTPLYSESDIAQCVEALEANEGMMIEPSGAIAVAPLLIDGMDLQERCAVCILTGGNS